MKKLQRVHISFINLLYKIEDLPWGHFIILSLSALISFIVFYILRLNYFATVEPISTITNLLTVNGVFSAILITYLFSRVTWTKDRKLELEREATSLSQKLTEFRRIIDKLTENYNVWRNDKASISLLKFGKFKNVDYYDFNLLRSSNLKPKNESLINELQQHPDYSQGQTTLYLAMVSVVSNRNQTSYIYNEELYKDFQLSGLYSLYIVQRWINCEIFGTIGYWLGKNYQFINYDAIKKDKDYILSAASRINEKYKGYELNEKLISELADDFNSHYIVELRLRLKELNRGARGLNLSILILISLSLIFGVLAPFALLLIQNKTEWFKVAVSILSSINSGLIAYFILRFPFLVNKELKWI